MKKIATLLVSFFIVAISAGCFESNIPEATPIVMPTATPTAIPIATLTSEMAPNREMVNRNDLGQRIYTKLTPEMAEELRGIKEECPECHHDYPYSRVVVEINGELWWACEGFLDPSILNHECKYIKKVTEREILTKYGYTEQLKSI